MSDQINPALLASWRQDSALLDRLEADGLPIREAARQWVALRPALEALIALWRVQLTTYPPSDMGLAAAAAVKVCADELAAVLKSTQMSEGQ